MYMNIMKNSISLTVELNWCLKHQEIISYIKNVKIYMVKGLYFFNLLSKNISQQKKYFLNRAKIIMKIKCGFNLSFGGSYRPIKKEYHVKCTFF